MYCFKKYKLKKIYYQACFVLLLILCSLLFTGFAYAQTDDDRITQLRQQIEALQKEAEQYKGSIAEQQAKAKTLSSEISIINTQIKKIQTQISLTSKNIDKTGIEITGLEGNISDTQKSVNYKKDTMARMLLSVYKQDNENLALVLLKNASISEFFQKVQHAARTHRGDLLAPRQNLELFRHWHERERTPNES